MHQPHGEEHDANGFQNGLLVHVRIMPRSTRTLVEGRPSTNETSTQTMEVLYERRPL
jgi:hypothetical protein